MKRPSLLDRLSSPKLAAWLIGILILMSLLVFVLPQRGYLGEQFNQFVADVPWLASLMSASSLDRVFGGWPIVVVAALLALNVSACTLRRILRRRQSPPVTSMRDAEQVVLTGAGDQYLTEARHILTSAGYSVLADTEQGFTARAGGSGFWGSILLHVSLLVIIAGGAVTAVTSFRGEMVITDGQTVSDVKESYSEVVQEPRFGNAYSGTAVSLDSTKIGYERGVVVSAVAKMRALEPGGRVISRDVRVNHPLDAGGKSYLLQDSGYAVALVLTEPGRDASTLVVNLAEKTERGWRDSLTLETAAGPVNVDMVATPKPLGPADKMPAEEFDFGDPRLNLVVSRGEGPPWSGELAEGQMTPAAAGISLTFEELRLWNRFLVRGAPARWITYVGFWLAVIGSAWRFLVPERRVSVVVSDSGTSAAALSHRARPWSGFEAAADERLLAALRAAAAQGDDAPDEIGRTRESAE